MKLLIAFAALLCSTVPSRQLFAQLNPEVVVHQGREGVWFETNEAEQLLFLVEHELPAARRVVAVQEQLIRALEASTMTASSALSLAAAAQETAQLAVTAQPSAWWQSKVLWFAVGLVIGGGGVVFAVSR